MSIRAVDWVLNSEVKPMSDRFILIVLANYCNSFGIAYPSITRITEQARLDRKTVVKSLKRLREKGMIEDTGKRTGVTKRVIVYRLPWAVEERPEETVPKADLLNRSVSVPNRSVSVPKQVHFSLENRQEPL